VSVCVCVSVGGWAPGFMWSVWDISVGTCRELSMEARDMRSLCGCGYGFMCAKGLGRGVLKGSVL